MLKGITVLLYERSKVGTDTFNRPIYEEVPEAVNDVLVAPLTEQEVISELNLSGKKAVYTLAIPKTDNHIWENKTVEFFGEKWRTVGMPIRGIDDMIPLRWNAKVRVERFE